MTNSQPGSDPADPGDPTVSNVLAALTSGGVLTFALAPLAFPLIGLTIVCTLPLLLIGVVLSIPVALVAGVVYGIRALLSRQPERAPRRASSPHPRPASAGGPDTRG